jgi:hypothetical protein
MFVASDYRREAIPATTRWSALDLVHRNRAYPGSERARRWHLHLQELLGLPPHDPAAAALPAQLRCDLLLPPSAIASSAVSEK